MGGRWTAQSWELGGLKEFQSLLVSLLKENEIEFVHVKESDDDARFLRCVELVKQLMGEQG